MAPHLRSEDLAAYLSGGLDGATRGQIDAHLAECRTCRNDLIAARRVLAGTPRMRRWPYVATGLIAAILAVVIVVPRTSTRGPVPDAVREDASDSSDVIGVVSPTDGVTISDGAVVFVWHNRADRPLFRLSLNDATGRELWRTETSDSTLTLPQSIELESGRTYYWYVDALTVGGRAVSTGAQSFTIQR